jgi:BASS family bile acid:Na+ symporter
VRAASFIINKLMWAWLIIFGLLAYAVPRPFLWLHNWVTYLLGAVILVMSLTLTMPALGNVFRHPRALIAGFVIKWITVPLAGLAAAHLVYASQPLLAAGTILDGSTPAGVSSNLFTYIGHGSVALAVSLTFIHTVLSPLLTPAFTAAWASKYVPVSFVSLLIQMVELVLVPVALGLAIRYGVGEARIRKAEPVLPMISAILLYAIELGLISPANAVIAKNLQWIPVVTVTTTCLILVNLAVAYGLARLLRTTERQARAIMFDTGVYNSGLGAVLAATNFGAFAALPALMNATMNLIVGAILASILQNYPTARDEGEPAATAAATARTAP